MSGEDVSVAKWKWQILRSDLSPSARHVALTMAVHLDGNGSVKTHHAPGVNKLAEETGRKRDTVIAAQRELVGADFLRVVRAGGGRGFVSIYQATLPAETVPEGGPIDDPKQSPDGDGKERVPETVSIPQTGLNSPLNGPKQSLKGDTPTTHHPTTREGGGGGGAGVPAPADAGPAPPSIAAVAVLADIKAGLPERADFVAQQLHGLVDAELLRGTDPARIVSAATIDTANVKPKSWTRLIASRLKAVERWAASTPDGSGAEPQRQAGRPGNQALLDDFHSYEAAIGKIVDDYQGIWDFNSWPSTQLDDRLESELRVAIWHDDGEKLRQDDPHLRVLTELGTSDLVLAKNIASTVLADAQRRAKRDVPILQALDAAHAAIAGGKDWDLIPCPLCKWEVKAGSFGSHIDQCRASRDEEAS